MQAQGYIGYGFYLNKTQSNVLKKAMITDGDQAIQDEFDEAGDRDGYSYYVSLHFPHLDIHHLNDGYSGDYVFQDQDRSALIAVYIKERMNYIGSKTVDFSAPSQPAQDELEAFKKKFGLAKDITLIHWISYEDN